MNDSVTKFISSLDLDYSKAIISTAHFAQQIESLDKQLQGMKGIAQQTAKDINSAFASQLGSGAGAKTLVDQYGNAFKSVQQEAKKTSASLKDNANYIKQSTLEQMKAQAASVQQRVTTKKLSDDYSTQAKTIREQVSELQKKLQLSGKLSAEEIKQTQNLQEQLQILKQQTSANISDDIASGRGRTADEWNRRTSWFLSGTLFYGMINGGKEAVSTIKDVEMGMVEIARIMDDSTFSFEGYRNQLLQLGVDYGQTFDTVQDIALRWAQAGYNVKDSLELTQTALLALNTAELDAANATESMIGIMAQWGLQAGDLELVIDKINKTADDYTVSSQDLVDGLLRSSSAAKNMNMTIEDTIALLTVMREASGRTGQEVGNALNSILSYVQRDKSIDVLESLGIGVFTDATRQNFRSAMDIFRDIAANWGKTSDAIKDGFVESADDAGLFNEELAVALGLQEEWNDLQQRDLAQASAGVYRRNYYIGMIERMSNTQEILNNMMTAGGYSMRENANTMDTLEKKYTSLKASIEQLAVALGDAGLLDMLKSGVDVAINFTQALSNLDDEGKALLLTALELITAFTAIKTIGSFTGISGGIKGLLETAGIALPSWTKLIPLILGTVAALGLYIYNSNKANDVTREFSERQEKLISSSQKQKESIENTKNEMLTQAETAERLANKIDELTAKENLNISEKAQMKSIVQQLNDIMPSLNLNIDEQTGKITGNTEAIYKNVKALKEQALQQARTSQMQVTANEYVQQEILVGDTKTRLDEEYARLQELQNHPAYKEILKAREQQKNNPMAGDITAFGRSIAAINQKHGLVNIEQDIAERKLNIDALTSEYKDINARLLELDDELNKYIDGIKSIEEKPEDDNSKKDPYIPPSYVPTSSSSKNYSNKALDEALKLLDYRKYMNQISIADEIDYLNQVKATHINAADELMDINKRLYSAEKNLLAERLKISTDWISEKKSLNELSVDEEIAAWNRVLANQSNNIEAVKLANTNLYRLRKQQIQEATRAEENSIKHLTNLGILSTKEQIKAYKELYSVKAESLSEEQSRIENLFNLYKKLLSEQQAKIKEAYDERIRKIDEEAEAEKAKKEERIKGLQEELDLLDRKDSQRSYEQTIADIRKEIEYWQVRTSEEARKKVIELEKQLDEEKYKRELELKKQSINDKIDELEDEVSEIDRLAEEEKKKWEKSYNLTLKAFDEHSSNIVALAGAMSKEAYSQWEQNYLIPLQNALSSGSFADFDSISNGLSDSIGDLDNQTKNTANAQIYNAASSILELKRQWHSGDKSASDRAIPYYDSLYGLGVKGSSVADQLKAADYESSKSIVADLPRYHKGRLNGMEEIAVLRKDEIVFPPELSRGLRALFPIISNIGKSGNSSSYDNRKEIKIEKLVNIENNYMEDDADEQSFAREISRTLNSLI